MQKNRIKNKTSIALNFLLAILYTLEYIYAYENFVIERFGYMNLTYAPLSGTRLVLLLQAAIPFVFYRGFKNIASGLSLFVYVFVYIPFVVTLHLADLPMSFRWSASIVFFVIMCVYFITDSHSSFTSLFTKKKAGYSFQHFELLALLLFALALVINRNNITFVNFLSVDNALYELRAEEGVGKMGRLNVYLTLWLSHAFIPILLVYYYIDRRWVKFSLAVIGMIVMFMIDKQKITFIIPFVMWGMLYVYRKWPNFILRYFHILLMTGLAVSSFFVTNKAKESDNIAFQGIAMILVLRTQCIEGEQLDRYTHFFEMEGNPHTYYSHIGIVNKITHSYPYHASIGQMVADEEGNSNATFLLMDGIAAAGLLGCIIISILFVFVKSVLNSMGKRYDNTLLLIILLFSFLSVVNASLFTSLLSFGLVITYLSLLFFRFPALNKDNMSKL